MDSSIPQPDYLTHLYRDVLHTPGTLAREAVERIRREEPGYRAVDLPEHTEWLTGQMRLVLGGLAENRRPTPHDLAGARALGAHRALQGLRLESVVTAYHLSYQQLWAHLRARAPGHAPALLAGMDLLWTWLEAMSAATADGHAEAVNQEQAHRIDTGHRLIESLYAGQADQEPATVLARRIGFNPGGPFCVIGAPAGHDTRTVLDTAARQARVPAHVQTHQDAVLLLLQTTDPAAVLRAATPPATGLGVSSTRTGLPGLAECLREAGEAMALARHTGAPAVDYATDWWAITLHHRRARIAPLIASDVPRSAPHLAEAVTAYANNGFSITAAGTALNVHPNTVKYRLDRWHTLTGWDVRTIDGLQRSLANLTLGPWA